MEVGKIINFIPPKIMLKPSKFTFPQDGCMLENIT